MTAPEQQRGRSQHHSDSAFALQTLVGALGGW
jgi:hypothetical protein